MFARQDKLKQHLDSHLQTSKKKTNLSSPPSISTPSLPVKGKRGRPRKVNAEQTAMQDFLKFGEFSSLLDKSQTNEGLSKNDENSGKTSSTSATTTTMTSTTTITTDLEKRGHSRDDFSKQRGELLNDTNKNKEDDKDKDNYGCQVENGQDIV
ncbi:uncharacterized protein LOC122514269 [Polistes fuscatus]|uniref:uncharacterized protein LOC122514269 n=1 Tax=Polistes fuscatus TaxID=30207 RepID=UPI001CAA3622|nr:uncharacterized protein LOC122514269 [Polistes fuscatus]